MPNPNGHANESSSNRPISVIRFGALKAAVWRNMVDMGNSSRPMYNVTLSRSYRDAEDQWKDTSSLGYDDLLTAAKVLNEAHSFIAEQLVRDADEAKREERKPDHNGNGNGNGRGSGNRRDR